MIKCPEERLSSFYLGARYDTEKGELTDEVVNYDARDLVTHAVCVGMTGSGKTGLCVGLLEEAALDRVPAIIIDPKGDMTNLLLQFENLDAGDFQKWVNTDDARRKNLSIEEYAATTAAKWKKGLASWGQDEARIKALKASVDYTIFTPGSEAGIPINIMGSFSAPSKADFDKDPELFREKIYGNVAAILAIAESKEDPKTSKEGVLLTNIFEHHWRNEEDLDFVKLIRAIQQPPFTQLGVFDLDTFYPAKERLKLAMQLNALLASPQFQNWLKGEDLDIEKIYFTADGKPRHSVFYLAHLSETERMFFVTLLLNSVVTWMRSQSGTTSLRSLLYFDEIFGYFPPVAEPPSKKPLLSLLKQARAFGLGTVLVTQNPVDIDYKGLSNAGTWFIGKLQTERDKARVLDGLKGAIAESGNNNDLDFSKIITALDSRVFLMHNVHADGPVVFHTRWAMSYLRGPITRPQIKELMADKKQRINAASKISFEITNDTRASTPSASTLQHSAKASPPAIDPAITQKFLNPQIAQTDTRGIFYRPLVLASAKARFLDEKRGIDKISSFSFLCPPPDEFGRIDFDQCLALNDWDRKLQDEPLDNPDISFDDLPDTINSSKEMTAVKKEFASWIYQTQKDCVLEHSKLKLTQKELESDEAFQLRVQIAGREMRDEAIDDLEEKYALKLDRLKDKLDKEERDLDHAEAEISDRRNSEILNGVMTVFKVFTGRSKSLGTAATKRRMSRRAGEKKQDILEDIENLHEDINELKTKLRQEIDEINDHWDTVMDKVTTKEIKPRKSDIKVETVMLVWKA